MPKALVGAPVTPYLTVVVPAFNEAEGITRTLRVLLETLDRISCRFEIVVVDDGSIDRTAERVRACIERDSRVRLEQHAANLGIGAGILTGIKAAQGEWLIFIPADLAMVPDQIRAYLDASESADIVLGNRSDRRDYTLARKLVSYANILLLRTLFGLKQHQFAYINCYRTALLKKIKVESRGVFISPELVIKARDLGARIVEVEIDYVPRKSGRAMGARPVTVVRALVETWVFWMKWAWRSITRQRAKGYHISALEKTRPALFP